MNALTTLKLTSASSSARRISRSAASTVCSVRRSPRSERKTPCRRSLSESNIGEAVTAFPEALRAYETNVYRKPGGLRRQLQECQKCQECQNLGVCRRSDRCEFVPELLLLGLQVAPGVVRRCDLQGEPFRHRELVTLDADQLAGIVRQQ